MLDSYYDGFVFPTQVLRDVHEERLRQEQKWGEQNRCPTAWIAICVEELGEATRHALNLDVVQSDENDWKAEERDRYRKEMVQLAACAIAAVEAIDRGKWLPGELRSRNEGKPEN